MAAPGWVVPAAAQVLLAAPLGYGSHPSDILHVLCVHVCLCMRLCVRVLVCAHARALFCAVLTFSGKRLVTAVPCMLSGRVETGTQAALRGRAPSAASCRERLVQRLPRRVGPDSKSESGASFRLLHV